MPKVLSRQPRWLDYNSPAFDLFQSGEKDKTKSTGPGTDGPSRKIAYRGTELFVAVGNELRWSDLAILKDAGDRDGNRSSRPDESTKQPQYKVLKTPSYRPIQQLTVSPSGDFIAVLTSHTCHVCLIPPHEHLHFQDPAPIKLRSYQVGPTTHVLEQSPLVSAVWHPLSPSGNGLVTVTKDACVRLWELDQNNRSTVNEPALAVDLKKLANASSAKEDFSASKYGTNKGFSPDDVEMEVAGSCFGGVGRDDEDGWSSMTFWVAMSEGDVYALCPFLPSKFWAPATMLPSLSTSVVAKKRVLEQDRHASELQRIVAQQQSAWLADLDQQEPITIPGTYDKEVYSRPERSAVPRLQGPFQLSPEPDFGEVTDIHVVAPKTNDESLFDEEEDFDWSGSDEGLSVGIVCLATSTNKIHICLNSEGVEAEWLPSKRAKMHYMNEREAVKDLLLLETVDLDLPGSTGGQDCWPTFTASPAERYEVFTTQSTGIFSLSLKPWVVGLEEELSAPGEIVEGIGFRLNVLLESSPTTVEKLVVFDGAQSNVNAAIAVLDAMHSDVGYVVLTSTESRPWAVLLDVPTSVSNPFAPDAGNSVEGSFVTPESRAPYQPSEVFSQQSALPAQLEAWRRESATGGHGDIEGQVRFSPYTLQKITEAHRSLSTETHNLGIAAADLFRRCERMVSEMKAQVEKVKEASNRINSVTGEDEFPEQAAGSPELVRGGKQKIQDRIQARKDKTEEIKDRVENLRRKMRGLGGRELSAKETAFSEEVARLEKSILPSQASYNENAPTDPLAILKMENSHLTLSTESRTTDDTEGDTDTIVDRFKAVQEVYSHLMEQAKEVQIELESKLAAAEKENASSRASTAGGKSKTDYRQQKLSQVFALLERESALVDAVSERLETLQLAATAR